LATHLSASSAATCKQYVAELNLDESDEELKSARCNDGELGELEELLQDDAARQVANALAHLRYERGFQRPDVQAAKAFAKVVAKRTRQDAFHELKDLLRSGVERSDVDEALEAAQLKAFRGVETVAQEQAYLRRTLPMLHPRLAELGEGHRVVTVSVLDAVIRLLQMHKGVRDHTIAKSEEWKRGDKWKQPEMGKFSDMDCGSVMRNHEHLMRPAAPGEERDLRVAAILYADEVETVDTGYAKSKHKLLTIQLTLANLPVTLRFDHNVIQLVGLARHPVVSRWGQAGIFAGTQPHTHTLAHAQTETNQATYTYTPTYGWAMGIVPGGHTHAHSLTRTPLPPNPPTTTTQERTARESA
jgi:hypothetical protein